MRKRPVRHHVKSHRRRGKPVRSFVRGHGEHAARLKTRGTNAIGPDTKIGTTPKAFTINFDYSKADSTDGESVVVISTNFEDALNEGYENRHFQDKIPWSVEVVDPDLGMAVKSLLEKEGGKAKYGEPEYRRAGGLGARFKVFAGIAKAHVDIAVGERVSRRGGLAGKLLGGHFTRKGSEALQEVDNRRAQRYLKDCWSDNPGIRATARASLKRFFPQIYNSCDFSHEQRIVSEIHKTVEYKTPSKRPATDIVAVGSPGWVKHLEEEAEKRSPGMSKSVREEIELAKKKRWGVK